MGYETTLLVGIPTTIKDKDGGIYFAVYAALDMCKLGHESAVLDLDWQNKEEGGDFWYHYHGTDGDIQRNEDYYGDKPKPVPIGDVIRALEMDMARTNYRRLRWAYELLRAMERDDENIAVLFFGH